MNKKFKILSLVLVYVFSISFIVFSAGSTAEEREIVLRWASPWVGIDSKAQPTAELMDEFNTAHQGKIRVVIEPNPDYNAYDAKVRTAIAAGIAPADIWTIRLNPTTAEFYRSDLLFDFSDVIEGEWKERFDEGPLEMSVIDGQLKSIPYEIAILPIWYNMDLLAQVGVYDVPNTMDEFWNLMEALKQAGIYPTSQMTGDNNAFTSMIWFSHFAASLGGPDVWSLPFTDPIFVEAAELTKRMIVDYSTPDAIGLRAGESAGHFLAQRTAVFANGSWFSGRADLHETTFVNNIKLSTLPPMGPYENAMITRVHRNFCAAVVDDPRRQDAIIEFLKFMTLRDNVTKMQEQSGSLMVVKNDAVAATPIQEQFYILRNSVSYNVLDVATALGAEVQFEFTQQLSNLALGRITAEEFTRRVAVARGDI